MAFLLGHENPNQANRVKINDTMTRLFLNSLLINPNFEFRPQIHSVRFEVLLTAPLKPQVKINDSRKDSKLGLITYWFINKRH